MSALNNTVNASKDQVLYNTTLRAQLPFFALCLVIFATELVPPLPVYIGAVRSLAPGMIMAAAFSLVISSVNFSILYRKGFVPAIPSLSATGTLLILFLVAFLCIHGVIASRFLPVNFHRLILSMVPLVFLLAGALVLGSALRSATASHLHNFSWIAFFIFLVIIALRLLKVEPRAGSLNAPTFPFTETSHFALAFGPIYLYRSVTAPKRNQLFWVFFGFLVALVLKSATFIVFAFGAAMLCRKLLITSTTAVLLLVAGVATHLSYFTSRADISSHSSNISALVYLQGWDFLWHSLLITRGWGLGFQQLGEQNFHLTISSLISALNSGIDLNTKDGGFLLSKLGSEFGVFGLLVALWYCAKSLKYIRSLRKTRRYSAQTLPQCIFVAFGVDIFVRGVGYFYGSPLLFLGAAFALSPGIALLRSRYAKDSQILLGLG